MCFDWGERGWVLGWPPIKSLLTHASQQKAFISRGAIDHLITGLQQGSLEAQTLSFLSLD